MGADAPPLTKINTPMKSFFKFMFASMLGTFILSIITFFIFVGIIVSVVSSSEEVVNVKQNSILHIKLEAPIVDRSSDNPFENIKKFNFEPSKNLGLNQILESIEKATNDPKIAGAFLDVASIAGGMASIQEIRHALTKFKNSGKFVVAYGTHYSQSAYYLASVADKMFLHEIGGVAFQGIQMQAMFFKNLLDKIGVDMQVVRYGKFKSAVEPFLYDKMSSENREQLLSFSSSLWNNMLEDIAKDRKLELAAMNKIADSLSGFFAEGALKHKLVDSLVIRQDVLNYLMAQTKAKDENNLNLISLEKYSKSATPPIKTSNKIAVIYAQGEIGTSKGNNSEIGTENIVEAIRKAAKDDHIKAIVLRVNSPGGAVVTSELIYNEVLLAKEKKPVIASFGNYAASGGYYISCACTKIISDPNTLTGSIGVFGVIPNTEKLLKEKIGITIEEVKTNSNSGFIGTTRKMTSFEEATLYKSIEKTYLDFIGKVAQGRNLTVAQVDSVGQGRIWSGTDAQKLGLVDELGGLKEAIAQAAEMSGVETYKIVELPAQKDLITQLSESLNSMSVKSIENEFGEFAYIYNAVKTAKQYEGVQARMPYILEIK